MKLPIRLRLTLWYVVLLSLILVSAGGFLVLRLRTDLIRALDHTLQNSATEIAADFTPALGQTESEFRDVTDTSLAGLPRDASAAQVVTPGGLITVSAGNGVGAGPMLPAGDLAAAAGGATIVRTTPLSGVDYRVYAVAFDLGGRSNALVVATSLEQVEGATHQLILLLSVLIPFGIALAAIGGWWLAGKALRPVALMTEEAAAIETARPEDRIEVPSRMDELGRLAVTLNAMLDRIRSSVDQQRAFVSNASHELRTPLAIMRAEIDVSLAAPGLSEESHDTLTSAREETDRMRAIVEDLLLLARMDEGALEFASEPVELGALVTEAVQAITPLAADRRMELSMPVGQPTTVLGDVARLRQVVRNLLENAIKYSPPDGTIRVKIGGDGDHVNVVVANSGRGIPAEDVSRIFDRFYRSDQSRSHEAGGSGLGLAIVRELVEAQGGRVWARSRPGSGTEIGCSLLAAPADSHLVRERST
jgi:heavy metal sensor kinase